MVKSLRSSLDDTEERRFRISLLRFSGLRLQFGVGDIVGESVSEEVGALVGGGGTGVGPGPAVGGLGVGPGPGFIVGGFTMVGAPGVGPGPGVGCGPSVGGFGVGPGPGVGRGPPVGGLGVGDRPSSLGPVSSRPPSLDLLLDLDLLVMLLLILPRLRKKYSVSAMSSKSPNAS